MAIWYNTEEQVFPWRFDPTPKVIIIYRSWGFNFTGNIFRFLVVVVVERGHKEEHDEEHKEDRPPRVAGTGNGGHVSEVELREIDRVCACCWNSRGMVWYPSRGQLHIYSISFTFIRAVKLINYTGCYICIHTYFLSMMGQIRLRIPIDD